MVNVDKMCSCAFYHGYCTPSWLISLKMLECIWFLAKSSSIINNNFIYLFLLLHILTAQGHLRLGQAGDIKAKLGHFRSIQTTVRHFRCK